jgi:hypothetical protein
MEGGSVIPYSVAREIHRRVTARMTAEGLKRHRHYNTSDGYGAAFYGPAIEGKHPATVVRITALEARVAGDIGEFDSLVNSRCHNAMLVYRDRVQQGPPADELTPAQRKRLQAFLESKAMQHIMNEGAGPPGMKGGLNELVNLKSKK